MCSFYVGSVPYYERVQRQTNSIYYGRQYSSRLILRSKIFFENYPCIVSNGDAIIAWTIIKIAEFLGFFST